MGHLLTSPPPGVFALYSSTYTVLQVPKTASITPVNVDPPTGQTIKTTSTELWLPFRVSHQNSVILSTMVSLPLLSVQFFLLFHFMLDARLLLFSSLRKKNPVLTCATTHVHRLEHLERASRILE